VALAAFLLFVLTEEMRAAFNTIYLSPIVHTEFTHPIWADFA
jgi:hypothetical protein